MIRRNSASALSNDRRVRNIRFIANVLNVVNNVARVLLQRVIHAGFEVRLRAIIINAQAAANVQHLQTRPNLFQINIDPGTFNHGRFNLADVRNLASQVEMQQLQRVFHAAAF